MEEERIARTLCVALYSSEENRSTGLASVPFNSHRNELMVATRTPFSRTSIDTAPSNLRRCSPMSGASSTPHTLSILKTISKYSYWVNSSPVTRTMGCCMFHDAGMCSKEISN